LRLGCRDRRECGNGVVAALDLRRIGFWADKDKVVPRDLTTVNAVTLADEFLLGLGVVHENEIRIITPRRIERLTRALHQHMYRDAGLFCELRQDGREQSGIIDRTRRGEPDRLRFPSERRRRAGQNRSGDSQPGGEHNSRHECPFSIEDGRPARRRRR